MVIIETIEDIDTDNDGKISLAEYIGGQLSSSPLKMLRRQFLKYMI